MKENYVSTLNAADTLTELFAEGETVTMAEVEKLMTAYSRDILKNAKIHDIVVTTITEALKAVMDNSGYLYDMGWSDGKIQLSVNMPYNRTAVFRFALSSAKDRIGTLKETLDMIASAVQMSEGGFSIR